MADKSPRKVASKKPGKTIKDKRREKKEKQQAQKASASDAPGPPRCKVRRTAASGYQCLRPQVQLGMSQPIFRRSTTNTSVSFGAMPAPGDRAP